MAKRTNGGTTKPTAEEAKARRAPARRSAGTKKNAAAASAADMAASEQPVGQAPSNEDVARLAYELYLERGGVNGNQFEDWYEAERRLRARG